MKIPDTSAFGKQAVILAHCAPHESARQVLDLSQQSHLLETLFAGILLECFIDMAADMAGPAIAAETGATASEKPMSRAKMKRVNRTSESSPCFNHEPIV